MANRTKAMSILQEEAELQEIVRLVGQDALSPADRMTMETARMIREDFLQQNAFITEDAYSSYGKQYRLLDLVLQYDAKCRVALEKGADLNGLFNIGAREAIGRAKMAPQEEYETVYQYRGFDNCTYYGVCNRRLYGRRSNGYRSGGHG